MKKPNDKKSVKDLNNFIFSQKKLRECATDLCAEAQHTCQSWAWRLTVLKWPISPTICGKYDAHSAKHETNGCCLQDVNIHTHKTLCVIPHTFNHNEPKCNSAPFPCILPNQQSSPKVQTLTILYWTKTWNLKTSIDNTTGLAEKPPNCFRGKGLCPSAGGHMWLFYLFHGDKVLFGVRNH